LGLSFCKTELFQYLPLNKSGVNYDKQGSLHLHTFKKLLFFSAALHLLLFLVFSHQFHQTPLPSIKEKTKVKPIQATLYFPPIKKQLPVEVEQAEPPIQNSKPTTKKSTVKKLAEKGLPHL